MAGDLDPTRRIHPYLFEHHLNLRGFVRTAIGTCWPWRFWTTLSAHQRPYPARLRVYRALYVVRLCVAYRLYLRFDHPYLTVGLTQFVPSLFALFVLSRTPVLDEAFGAWTGDLFRWAQDVF